MTTHICTLYYPKPGYFADIHEAHIEDDPNYLEFLAYVQFSRTGIRAELLSFGSLEASLEELQRLSSYITRYNTVIG